ncbi:type IV secretion protein [Listeria monocytogenes]|nr:type IV secretion protein [Listeria monocytogenes]
MQAMTVDPHAFVSSEVIDSISQDFIKKHSELYLQAFTDEEAREVLRELIAAEHASVLNEDHLIDYCIQEMVGLGIIEAIIQDESVTDIRFNGTELIIKTNERKYVYEAIEVTEDYIIKIIQKFANAVQKEFTTKSPILSAEFKNLRINAIHKDISSYGTAMALRVTRPHLALNETNFSSFAPKPIERFLQAAAQAKSNIIISGETGTGKTELQKFLIQSIGFQNNIIMIEDTNESHVKTMFSEKDITSLLTSETIGIDKLVQQALRQDADYIIVSETRGSEAYQMLQGVLSGHAVITTLHARNANAIRTRFINMCRMEYTFDETVLSEDFDREFQLGIHIKAATIDGKVHRYLDEVIEFRPNGANITLYKQTLDAEGNLKIKTINPYSEELQEHFNEGRIDYHNNFTKELRTACPSE